jgi:hypothetical protein
MPKKFRINEYSDVEQLSIFEDVVRSLSSTCLYAVCSWTLTQPQHCIPLVLNTQVIQWNYLQSLSLLMKALACPKDRTMVNSWQSVFVHLTLTSVLVRNYADAGTIPTHQSRIPIPSSYPRRIQTSNINLGFTSLSLK